MKPDTLRESRLPGGPESASRARAEVRAWLGDGHPAYEPVRLAVSELVTNAVRHARHGVAGCRTCPGRCGCHGGDAAEPPLLLRLSVRGDRLRVEVADAGLAVGDPRVRADPISALVEGGRGLAIVNLISGGCWGFHSHPGRPGRTVWCEIPADPSPEDDVFSKASASPRSPG
ncbi:ATP-binding protein [Streptosporangium sp. NPDC004379]|uniref:ATP-binding protein n=1 Tax=Streptosporangium sp. NPDC004379 TaxID=3366189 RepID=UPI0036B4D54B